VQLAGVRDGAGLLAFVVVTAVVLGLALIVLLIVCCVFFSRKNNEEKSRVKVIAPTEDSEVPSQDATLV